VALVPAAQADGRSAGTTSFFSASCPLVAVSSPFLAWGDAAPYFLVSGGSFEGSHGWSLHGSTVVADTQPFQATVGLAPRALEMRGGSTATSPTLCADGTMPSLRVFVRRVSGNGLLRATATVPGGDGSTVDLGAFSAAPTWGPSAPLIIDPAMVNALSLTGALKVRLNLRADAGTVFRVDGVYVDPYRRV